MRPPGPACSAIWRSSGDKHLRLSRFKLAGPPTPRDTEASNAYAILHDSLGPVCICSLIGINSILQIKVLGAVVSTFDTPPIVGAIVIIVAAIVKPNPSCSLQ